MTDHDRTSNPPDWPLGQEKILCAANWYDYQSHDCGYIQYPNPTLNNKLGIVISGFRHGHCMYIFNAIMEKLRPDLKFKKDSENLEYYDATNSHSYQGFLTSYNRYVDRTEAWKIAETAGQIVRTVGRPRFLFSENLY